MSVACKEVAGLAALLKEVVGGAVVRGSTFPSTLYRQSVS